MLRWQNWELHVGFTPREGLVLNQVAYRDQGRRRPILFRASLSEMVVPYGDPSPTHFFKNAFDAGENGVGIAASPLTLGCDCLGEIRYLDVAVANGDGEPVEIPNAICIHEEDTGVLWRHIEWRSGEGEVRRGRRLVVSSFSAIGNYDYGFFWYLHQDGSIAYEVKLTGVLSTGAVRARRAPPPRGPGGARPERDGPPALLQPAARPRRRRPRELGGRGLDRVDAPRARRTRTATRSRSGANRCGPRPRHAGGSTRRRHAGGRSSTRTTATGSGAPVGYRLIPGENARPFADLEAAVMKRAGFIGEHLWVTPYEPGERYAAGEYPNQHPGGAGLPEWTAADRPIVDRDLVVWYTFGHHHVPRAEDWPVMPVATIGFALKPVNFFDRNPALDVPPPARPSPTRTRRRRRLSV